MSNLILVIEEDPILSEFLSTALEEEGYFAHVVNDREHALELIEAIPPELILLDYTILSADLLHSAQGHTIPVIMLSATEGTLSVNACHSTSKPFDINNLLTLIASALPAAED
jgi:two-component system response regulator RegX3